MDLDQQYERAILDGNLDLGVELAKQCAQSQGFNVFAYHGTMFEFDEFTEGDIGFHFSKSRVGAEIRISDKLADMDIPDQGQVLHVALSIHHPINVKCDFNCWDAQDLFQAASMKVTGEPFISPSTVFLSEQRRMANGAWKILKRVGFYGETVVKVHQEIHQNHDMNSFYTSELRIRLMNSRYDAIVYVNDYETQEGEDPTSYIVFSPNQIKSLEPVYGNDGKLTPLSQRFDISSAKFK